MSIIPRLDHAVINVRFDLDGAEALFAALGFTLTPRGYHSHGSQNHLMMFTDDYLELIAVPEANRIERQDLVDAPLGINGVVFQTDDVDEVFERLNQLGYAGDPPQAFHRPVAVDGREHEARFRTVTVRADVFGAGRVYFAEHQTPELVWRPEWRQQNSGVSGIVEVVTVTNDAVAEAERFAALLGIDIAAGHKSGDEDGDGSVVQLDGTRLRVMRPQHYADRYGPLASDVGDRPAIFGALVLATTDRAVMNEAIDGIEGITATHEADRTLIRLDAYDALLEVIDT